MKLSNLRLERKNKFENGQSVCLICDVECNFSRTKELYFSVDDKYADWLTDDVYDAFWWLQFTLQCTITNQLRFQGLFQKNLS